MFSVYLTNFQNHLEPRFASFEEAVAFARSKGFEASILLGRVCVGAWSPICGARRWSR